MVGDCDPAAGLRTAAAEADAIPDELPAPYASTKKKDWSTIEKQIAEVRAALLWLRFKRSPLAAAALTPDFVLCGTVLRDAVAVRRRRRTNPRGRTRCVACSSRSTVTRTRTPAVL